MQYIKPRLVWAYTAAAIAALVLAATATAGVYDSAVLADAPSMYWRLGEVDGATTAADASGHGVTLTYTSAALLGEDAGIGGDLNTSLAGDGATAASRTPAGVSYPGMFEAWLRTNVPDSSATVYYQGVGGSQYSVTVGTDALLHATVVPGGPCCSPTVTMVGPSTEPVTDGFWHYVTVDFVNSYIYVDLTAGPPGTSSGGFGSPNVLGSASINLGAANFYGQLDEVAVYDTSLSSSRMSAHATAGILGWDASVPGGEEGSPAGCPEIGVFHKGAQNQAGTLNYTAFGALNYITTAFKKVPCGTALPLPPVPNSGGYPRPTFTSGQTVRVKTGPNGDFSVKNYYVEWGPISTSAPSCRAPATGSFSI